MVPPLACKAFEYDVALVPEGKVEVAIAKGTDETTSERATDLVCAGLPPSLTVAVKFAVPVAVGIPAIKPVVGARASPGGRLPAVMDQA